MHCIFSHTTHQTRFLPAPSDGPPAATALLGHRHQRAGAARRLRLARGALAAGGAEVVDAEPGLPEPGARRDVLPLMGSFSLDFLDDFWMVFGLFLDGFWVICG